MNTIGICILFFLITQLSFVYGQENDSWVLGTGVNIIDNSGSRFDELLNIEENWNLSRLIKVSIEKRFAYDFGIEAAVSLNSFSQGKIINSEINQEEINYIAIDIMAKNYCSNYWLDPRHAKYNIYVAAGWGGNFFNEIINNTINVGTGTNVKISTYTWLNFQTLGKFSIDDNTAGNANHLQHSMSVIFWL